MEIARPVRHPELRNPGELANTLRSQTRFTVKQAVVHGIDLLQAVKTVGLNRSGSTALDQLSGNFITQGRTMHLNDLLAESGQLSATGDITLSPSHALNGRISVDLKASAGMVDIPLAVSGTLENPSVGLSRSGLVGAALGSLVAPGVGTAAGAKWGDKVERWWSGKK